MPLIQLLRKPKKSIDPGLSNYASLCKADEIRPSILDTNEYVCSGHVFFWYTIIKRKVGGKVIVCVCVGGWVEGWAEEEGGYNIFSI